MQKQAERCTETGSKSDLYHLLLATERRKIDEIKSKGSRNRRWRREKMTEKCSDKKEEM